MIQITAQTRILVAVEAVDFRKYELSMNMQSFQRIVFRFHLCAVARQNARLLNSAYLVSRRAARTALQSRMTVSGVGFLNASDFMPG